MAESHDRNVNFPPEPKNGKDDEKNVSFTTTGDGTSWDSGRNSSIAHGTPAENDVREADAESPGVAGPKPNRDDAA